MATKPRKQQLKVVFDTNVLFTQVASDLLRADVAQLIAQHTEHSDLAVSWYLPAIVRDEREYQMVQRAVELLPSLEKLERVLGHQLGISEDILKQRITAIIDQHIQTHKLTVLPLDVSQVNWARLCNDATFRKPPFDSGSKEKGFRDALILESFMQLVLASPLTPTICRLVMLTDDQLLADAVRERSADRNNVMVVPSVEELRGFINTLISNVSEEFVAAIKNEAAPYFYDFDKKEGLFARWDITNTVRGEFGTQLKELPPGATSRDEKGWTLFPPQFVKKDGKRMHWLSRLEVEIQTYRPPESKSEDPNSNAMRGLFGLPSVSTTLGALSITDTTSTAAAATKPVTTIFSSPIFATERVPFKKGKTVFNITWSASVNQRRKLHSPELGRVTFEGTSWE